MTFTAISLAMDASDTMQELIWKHRVLILFTPDSNNPQYKKQNAILARVNDGLDDRDMIILRAVSDAPLSIDNVLQGQASEGFYQLYDIDFDQFRVVLVGKDGTVKLDQSVPVSADALFALIDAMPMRQYEMLQDDD